MFWSEPVPVGEEGHGGGKNIIFRQKKTPPV
jgi:hypothetical protein